MGFRIKSIAISSAKASSEQLRTIPFRDFFWEDEYPPLDSIEIDDLAMKSMVMFQFVVSLY